MTRTTRKQEAMTVLEAQARHGWTGEPDDVMGDPLALDAIITIEYQDGVPMAYCVGYANGNETWMTL